MQVADLARLSPDEFEVVCQDLFAEVLGIELETFGRGRDGGVDLRGWADDRGLVVVQCKHWRRSAANLVSFMRRDELPRIVALDPARYVLATSAELTPRRKDELVDALRPYVRSPHDVFLGGDIARELREHAAVVRRHARVWRPPEAIQDPGLVTRAGDLAAELRRSLEVFVPGRGYAEALLVLAREHVCLVTGVPGYGKTTLAHALAGAYAGGGYEILPMSEDADEVDRLWTEGRPQLFVADDFLAAGRLERRRHGATARLVRMIDRVGDAEDKRLVLTTREHVLRRAVATDEHLSDALARVGTVTLDLGEYDLDARERIVRNTAARSSLADVRRAVDDAAAAVARHRYFNPRTLATAVRDAAHATRGTPDAIADHVLDYLDDPSRRWRHIVENDLDGPAFDLLAVVFSFGRAPRRAVETAWEALRRHHGAEVDPREFDAAVLELTASMLRQAERHADERHGALTLYDEVVADFAAAYFSRHRAVLAGLFASAVYFEQVEQMWDVLAPHPGVVVAEAEEVRAQIVDAVYRTADSARLDPWGTFLHRTAAVADIAAGLGDESLRHLLRERLAAIEVCFAPCWDEEDESGLHIIVASLVAAGFTDEVTDLLLPAIRRIDVDDVDEVYCLAAFVDHARGLPDPVRDEAERLIRTVVDRAFRRWLAGETLDDDHLWLVGRMGEARGLDVPPVAGDGPTAGV